MLSPMLLLLLLPRSFPPSCRYLAFGGATRLFTCFRAGVVAVGPRFFSQSRSLASLSRSYPALFSTQYYRCTALLDCSCTYCTVLYSPLPKSHSRCGTTGTPLQSRTPTRDWTLLHRQIIGVIVSQSVRPIHTTHYIQSVHYKHTVRKLVSWKLFISIGYCTVTLTNSVIHIH
jgi:hypothetical protein